MAALERAGTEPFTWLRRSSQIAEMGKKYKELALLT
jgi:hypothetical protein